MSSEPFEITADPSRCLLRITARGLWNLKTVTTYKTALLAAVQRMLVAGGQSGEIVALFDAREGGPQSQEVVAEFRAQLGQPALAPRRLATLVGSALLRRQVDRIAIPNQRVFTNEAEALAWLLSPSDPA